MPQRRVQMEGVRAVDDVVPDAVERDTEIMEEVVNMTISEAIKMLDVLYVLDAPNLAQAINMAKDALREADKLGDLDRLRELMQADREGRCVVLPCKFGNKVYFPLLGRIIEKTVYSIVTFSNSQRIYCDGTSEFFRPENFGKTVFLTRAAAEKALEEMEGKPDG